MQRAHNLYSQFLVPRSIFSPCSAAAAVATLGRRSCTDTAFNCSSAKSEMRQLWFPPLFPFAPPSITTKSVSAGLAGAVTFSMAISSVVEAKEPVSLEFLPKDVVLYQYEACPFCNKVKGNFSFLERLTAKYAGAAVMYMVSKKLKKKYITDERAALHEAAEAWSEAINGREFLGGSRPNLADLSVFGVPRPIRYLKAGRDMVENTSIGEWYQRREAAVGESSRLQA